MVVARRAERALSRLLPRAVALVACAVIAGGSLAVADQRSDAARAREVLAVREFREDLRPIAEVVFDHVQPLGEAERQAEDDASGGFSAYVDVARDTSIGRAVRAQGRAFDDLTVPASLERVGDRLDVAFERLETAADQYEALPFDDTTGTVSLLGATRAAMSQLREGLAAWSAAMSDLYPQGGPAVMVPLNDTADPVRRPVSHPAYLLEVGRACGRADASGEGEGEQQEPTDAASGRRAAELEAGLVRELVAGLLAVPPPPSDAARLEQDVLVPLREYGRLADVLDRLAAEDLTSEQLFRELVAADAAGARVALGLGDYGSQTCALFFGS